jgi:hypothetical protein
MTEIKLWIWESRCSNKLKVFTWLLLMDRLNTRNILKRKNFKVRGDNYNCALCQLQREETAFHLFFNCPFSQDCWRHLNIQWNYQINFFATFQQARDLHGSPFFMEVFIIAAWQIWKQRNNFIFNRGRPSFLGWKKEFCAEALLQANRFSEEKSTLFSSLVNYYRYR